MVRWPSGTLSRVAKGSLATTASSAGQRVVVVRIRDHAVRVELGDLVLGIAQEPAQDFLVVLAHLRRGTDDGRGAAEVPEVSGDGDRAGQEIGHLHQRPPLPR